MKPGSRPVRADVRDDFRVAHFDARAAPVLTSRERSRVRSTVELVPPEWESIVDVGCGDGRVSAPLINAGREVVGLDWSSARASHCASQHVVCDIRKPWPLDRSFDGAICCEVLEHLLPEEATQVVANLERFTTKGFLITVPAREPVAARTASCHTCGQGYHVWGHFQFFETFDDVDSMVGRRSARRHLIADSGIRSSRKLLNWQRKLGSVPYDPSHLCPHCGTPQEPPRQLPLWTTLMNRSIEIVQILGSPFWAAGGWFACLYDKES